MNKHLRFAFLLSFIYLLQLTVRAQVISGGYAYHSIYICTDGTVRAWGLNDHGQLGCGDTQNRLEPVQVSGLTDVIAVGAGQGFSMALKSDGTVWTWGGNNWGQLGDSTSTDRYVPAQIKGLTNITAIAAGGNSAIVLKSDSTVWAWGWNNYGEVGDSTTITRRWPLQVAGLNGVTAISSGFAFGLVLKRDSTLWTWGWNYAGELGDSTFVDQHYPVQVKHISGVKTINAGENHSFAQKPDGSWWGWGRNDWGQLGDNTNMDRYTPILLTRLAGVTMVSGGGAHTLVLKADSTVWSFGWNGHGQLGDGTTVEKAYPVRVLGLTGITTIAGGASYSLALKKDFTGYGWGINNAGQLGDNTVIERLSPVAIHSLCLAIAPPTARFQSIDTTLCANDCISFQNLSSGATSYQWLFPGAAKTSDTAANPQYICYQNGGSFDVTLIAHNAGGTDTLILRSYIKVAPPPPAPEIIRMNDTTLYFHSNAAYASYQWYEDTTRIESGTDTLISVTSSGNYNVSVTDTNGCRISVGINITVGIRDLKNAYIFIYPNPAREQLTIDNSQFTIEMMEIYNILGKVVQQSAIENPQSGILIDVSSLSPGIYFLHVVTEKGMVVRKFVKI